MEQKIEKLCEELAQMKEMYGKLQLRVTVAEINEENQGKMWDMLFQKLEEMKKKVEEMQEKEECYACSMLREEKQMLRDLNKKLEKENEDLKKQNTEIYSWEKKDDCKCFQCQLERKHDEMEEPVQKPSNDGTWDGYSF